MKNDTNSGDEKSERGCCEGRKEARKELRRERKNKQMQIKKMTTIRIFVAIVESLHYIILSSC